MSLRSGILGPLMSYRWALFDADGTLFDYDAAEAAALERVWNDMGLEPGDRLLASYRRINGSIWKLFEQGRIEQARIPKLRFEQLLHDLGIDADAGDLSARYLAALGRETQLVDGAIGLLERLDGRLRMALATNGLAEVQRPRFTRSAIHSYFEVVLISGEIGVAKPDPSFFDVAFERMGRPARDEVVMVGDSLSSDIEGGRRYGIDTCWFNPAGRPVEDGPGPTFEVRELAELAALLAA